LKFTKELILTVYRTFDSTVHVHGFVDWVVRILVICSLCYFSLINSAVVVVVNIHTL